ncbi:Q-dependent dehydrogenase domain containing protein [Pandoravirus celtis]|uniref:Q-dependent dehydrogenase domain containing protein n=1 Tax=Pandoravirus celtis TaxID=2568002 RepID=A0A4D6EHV5_9VIRU|nr:Q-dependent dehydrogenase domain containing protein [Pandoravirus celtis]
MARVQWDNRPRRGHGAHLSTMVLIVTALMACTIGTLPASATYGSNHGGHPQKKAWWPNWGGGLDNDHHAAQERDIAACNVGSLMPAWVKAMHGDVASPPAVDKRGVVYIPDLGGSLWAVDGDTGATIWEADVGNFTGNVGIYNPATGRSNGTTIRGTPALHGEALFFGDAASGHVFAVSTRTGQLLWKTLVEIHPAAVITMSPTAVDGLVLVGVSSIEESFAGFPNYACCDFRGSLVALNARTGVIVWKTYTTVAGYAGAAIWGSSPSVDLDTRTVYVATGNNYKVPADVQACVDAHEGDASQCPSDPNNLAEAVIALDLDTGAVRWNLSFTAQNGVDVWTVGCKPERVGLPGPPNANCPAFPGEDADFGQAPLRFYYESGAAKVPLVGVGQKNGLFFALHPADGSLAWVTVVGHGGDIGGLQWGSAFDGTRIYVASSNSHFANETLHDGRTTRGGSWVALDPATGSVLWQTPVPEGLTVVDEADGVAKWPLAWSSLTVANGVVYAGTGSRSSAVPTMFALDAATGEILWTHVTGAATLNGPAVVDGTVYWGTGYGYMSTPGKAFYAFRPALSVSHC